MRKCGRCGHDYHLDRDVCWVTKVDFNTQRTITDSCECKGMKMSERYRLLKDIPGSNAGSMLTTDGQGCIRISVPHHPEWFEKVEEKPYPDPRSEEVNGTYPVKLVSHHISTWAGTEHVKIAAKAHQALDICLRRRFNGEYEKDKPSPEALGDLFDIVALAAGKP